MFVISFDRQQESAFENFDSYVKFFDIFRIKGSG